MAIYAIGDVQGCYAQLQQLLKKINFKSDKDQLWFAGDIINRGPDSLQTLRFIKSLGDNAITVLGNHDLHCLAIFYTQTSPGKKDTLNDILNAADCNDLLRWLRQQPLLHYHEALDVCMVHAGIYPGWSIDQAQQYAREVESILQSEEHKKFFAHMYGNKPDNWKNKLTGWDRYRFITNAFTRMRFCDSSLNLSLKQKGAPGSQTDHLQPWFNLIKNIDNTKIVFGHWSTLGMSNIKNIYPLDTGCLWGGDLTALKIDENMNKYYAIDCPQAMGFD